MADALLGTRALVVGFANEAGRAIATALAEAGADVATASATLDGEEVMAAKQAAKAVSRLGRQSFSQGWDVTLPTNVQVGLKQLIRQFGHPTVLVFNADAPLEKPLAKTTDSELGRVLQVNLAGAFYAARSFVKELPEGEAGHLFYIVPASSGSGGGRSAYTAAKRGVAALAEALDEELGPRVTVAALATPFPPAPADLQALLAALIPDP